MSQGHQANAPKVPDWDGDEILSYLIEEYQTPQAIEEEFGMSPQNLVSTAHDLEPSADDRDRQIHILDMLSELDEDYESTYWVDHLDAQYKQDAEEKTVYNGAIRHIDNPECWISVRETEYVEEKQ